jgi:T5SS/PEP-CTERM-associated repeat protein
VGNTANSSFGRVTISGFGVPSSGLTYSSLVANDSLIVAGDATTQVDVKDSGRITSALSISIGQQQGVGRLLVHGKTGPEASQCRSLADVSIGSENVSSKLNVSDKGVFFAFGQLGVGLDTGEEGEATVSDKDSSITAATVIVGGDGHGVLKILNGALVKSSLGSVGKGSGSSGSGVVHITPGFSTSEWHVFGNCDVGVDVSGTVNLHGASFGIGPTAKLTVDTNLTVGAHGEIRGDGTLTAGQIINNGFINPDILPSSFGLSVKNSRKSIKSEASTPSSAGTIQINGNYQQTATGAIRIQVAGLDPGKFDSLQINGDATLAGRVELAFVEGFVPKPGDTVEFLKVSGKATGALDVVPLIVDSSSARPALVVQAKMMVTPDGKGSLIVTDVRPTVQLGVVLDSSIESKVNLNFVPVTGSNHFMEFAMARRRFGMAAISGRTHNSGIISDRPTMPCALSGSCRK